jgi:hypothetical protein
MTGAQRLHQIETKVRLQAERDLRHFLAGHLDTLPCSTDRLRAAIIQALEPRP